MNADKQKFVVLLLAIGVYLRASAAPSLARQQGEGLDSLSDDALLEELASRGLDPLLDYAFVVI